MNAGHLAERLAEAGWVFRDAHDPPRFVKERRVLYWPFAPHDRLGPRVLERIARHTDLSDADLRP